jgi:multidrug efflux pump subunit AcrA (membrane-fusion protein)
MGSLEVEVDVSESNIRQTRPGQPCLITLDALPGEPYRGRVKKIVPTADRARATVLTKVSFDSLDARVLPEMSATVNFLPQDADTLPAAARTILSVPKGAVVERDGERVVFLARNDRAVRVAVETGQSYGGMLEARSGLHEGDIVVVDPPSALEDGSRIDTAS